MAVEPTRQTSAIESISARLGNSVDEVEFRIAGCEEVVLAELNIMPILSEAACNDGGPSSDE